MCNAAPQENMLDTAGDQYSPLTDRFGVAIRINGENSQRPGKLIGLKCQTVLKILYYMGKSKRERRLTLSQCMCCVIDQCGNKMDSTGERKRRGRCERERVRKREKGKKGAATCLERERVDQMCA